jgi:ABC-type uncharacterized transport system auxiliary subunit
MKHICILAAVGTLTIVSCTSYLPTYYYLIDTEPSIPESPVQYPFVVEIASFRAPSRYQDQLFYQKKDYEVGFYEHSKWVEPPAEMLQNALTFTLCTTNLFKRVDSFGSTTSPDLILQGNLLNFDQDIAGKDYYAKCKFRIELIKGDTGKPIWCYTAEGRAKQDTPGKFVPAMNAAVQKALKESITAMENAPELKEFAREKDREHPKKKPENANKQRGGGKPADKTTSPHT